MKILILAVLAAVFSTPALSLALAEDKDPLAPVEPAQAMLPSYKLQPENSRKKITFTPFFEVYDQKQMWQLCYNEPRIRDAFNTELMTRRVRVDENRRPILKPLEKRLRDLANRAIKRKVVKRLYLAEGEYDKPWAPDTPAPVPNPIDCSLIEFRARGIQ